MALQPSRPAFMLAGALLFLVPAILRATGAQDVETRVVVGSVAMSLVFLMLAARYRRVSRARRGAPPAP